MGGSEEGTMKYEIMADSVSTSLLEVVSIAEGRELEVGVTDGDDCGGGIKWGTKKGMVTMKRLSLSTRRINTMGCDVWLYTRAGVCRARSPKSPRDYPAQLVEGGNGEEISDITYPERCV